MSDHVVRHVFFDASFVAALVENRHLVFNVDDTHRYRRRSQSRVRCSIASRYDKLVFL